MRDRFRQFSIQQLGFFKTSKSHISALSIPCLQTSSRSILESNNQIMKVSRENVALRTCGCKTLKFGESKRVNNGPGV